MSVAVSSGSLVLVTAPAREPVSVADVKAWARVDHQLDDVIIAGLITNVRQQFDGDTWFGRALMTQTWDLFLDAFPCEEIGVPLPPLQAVTSITYTDSVGIVQTLSPSEYAVDTASEPGRIVPAYGTFWPSTQSGIPNAVTVRFVAGYGSTATAVPQPIRDWIKQAAAYLYQHRETSSLPDSFFWSMARYKASWGL